MTINSEISILEQNIASSYNTIKNKGGSLPEQLNTENLAGAIATLEDAGVTPGEYGALYYLVGVNGKTVLRGVQLNTIDDFNAMCTDGNQQSSITINGQSILKSTIVRYTFGSAELTSLPDNFCYYFSNMSQMSNMPDSITSIGSNFMRACQAFNQSIHFSNNLQTIGSYCLANNYKRSANTDLSNTKLTSLPDYFMAWCYNFNGKLTLPASLKSIGNRVLQSCNSFSQVLEIPESVESIGDFFLSWCHSYNVAITIPGGVRSIGDYFMNTCYAFNSEISLGDSIETIGDYFMSRCIVFNQALTMPASLKSIGTSFLNRCISLTYYPTFNCPNLTTIGDYFLNECAYLSGTGGRVDLTNTTVAEIGRGFLWGCTKMKFMPEFPQTLTKVGDHFMRDCFSLCMNVNIPSSLTEIGSYFFSGCNNITRNLSIPDGLKTIPAGFMYNCDNFTGQLNIPAGVVFEPSDFSLSIYWVTGRPAYIQGIRVTGDGAAACMAALPNHTSSPYRKLVSVTANEAVEFSVDEESVPNPEDLSTTS